MAINTVDNRLLITTLAIMTKREITPLPYIKTFVNAYYIIHQYQNMLHLCTKYSIRQLL